MRREMIFVSDVDLEQEFGEQEVRVQKQRSDEEFAKDWEQAIFRPTDDGFTLEFKQ